MKYLYEAILTPNDVGGYDAFFPDFDLVTQGDDEYDAVFMAQDLLQVWIIDCLRRGVRLPKPCMDHQVPEGGRSIGIAVECDAGTPEVETMTAQEAADVLGVTKARVYAMIRDGVLESRKVGNMQMVSAKSVKRRFDEPRRAGRPRKQSTV